MFPPYSGGNYRFNQSFVHERSRMAALNSRLLRMNVDDRGISGGRLVRPVSVEWPQAHENPAEAHETACLRRGGLSSRTISQAATMAISQAKFKNPSRAMMAVVKPPAPPRNGVAANNVTS
jgi:hypothetical protein